MDHGPWVIVGHGVFVGLHVGHVFLNRIEI